jgi:septum formation inhibitor-activating ATPase MinD
MPMIAPQVQNAVGQMDVDIIIEDAPDYVSLRQEEFEQLAQMAQQGMPIPPEMLIEASSVRNKKRILEMLTEQKQQATQGQQQAMQAQMQVEQAKMQMEGQRVQIDGMAAEAKAAKDMADANQTNAETQLGLIQRRLTFGM